MHDELMTKYSIASANFLERMQEWHEKQERAFKEEE